MSTLSTAHIMRCLNGKIRTVDRGLESFTQPHRQKSHGVKIGLGGGQSVTHSSVAQPIHEALIAHREHF